MPDNLIPPIPQITATEVTVVPPAPAVTYDQWFLTSVYVNHKGGPVYDLECFWTKGNNQELSEITTNNVVRNIANPSSLVEQLGFDFLKTNPDVATIIPQFLEVMSKVAKKQGVL
jgi:hypothetical protein